VAEVSKEAGNSTAQVHQKNANNADNEAEEGAAEGHNAPVAIFEYKDAENELTQRFIMTPRYYLADEADGEGDGTYEFRPLNQPPKLYSDLDKVEVHEGDHSGQFLITFEEIDDVSVNNASLA
jgi:hypothetical protein